LIYFSYRTPLKS